jgi:hypothetical protein
MRLPQDRRVTYVAAWTVVMIPVVAIGTMRLAEEFARHGYGPGGWEKPFVLITAAGFGLAVLGRPYVRLMGLGVLGASASWVVGLLAMIPLGIFGLINID